MLTAVDTGEEPCSQGYPGHPKPSSCILPFYLWLLAKKELLGCSLLLSAGFQADEYLLARGAVLWRLCVPVESASCTIRDLLMVPPLKIHTLIPNWLCELL